MEPDPSNTADESMAAGGRKTFVYVLIRRNANARVKSLARLANAATEVVFVSGGGFNEDGLNRIEVTPSGNPLWLVRRVGFHRTARFLDSALYVHNRHQLYVGRVVAELGARIRGHLECGDSVTLMTCLPPHPLALAGLRLKRRFPEIRWVIDWQDLWSSDETYFTRVFPPYRPLVRRLERRLVQSCDLNVATNDRARRWLEQQFGVSRDRTAAIGHHVDSGPAEPAWAGRVDRARREPRIVFMGRMFKGNKVPGAEVLRALRAVRARGRMWPELHLYGRQGPEFTEQEDTGCASGVTWHGVVEQASVVSEIRKYDYALLVLGDVPNSRLIMHLKLPEYLVAGPPILAIVPSDSAVADIVRRTGTGFVIPAEGDWATGLEEALAGGARTSPSRVPDEIERYFWNSVREQWRAALDIAR
ncbi:MAG: glycosyltransferase [Pseudomonadales bacterium]